MSNPIAESGATEPVYTYYADIRQRDVDQFDRLTPTALYGSMQDAAIAHSMSKGLSGKTFMDLGYAWMLNRIHISVKHCPTIFEAVTVRTWASNLTGLYAIREFELLDEFNQVRACGTSRWVVIDLAKKRAVRLPNFLAERYGVLPKRALEDDFPKFDVKDTFDRSKEFQVRWSELDGNQHANSACYVDWFVEAVPTEILQTHDLKELELEYKRELVLGDTLTSACTPVSANAALTTIFDHKIINQEGQVLTAKGRTVWAHHD